MSQRPPISPRSPRAALEPEQVPQPPKRSQRARNPLVIVGNAVFTVLVVAMLLAGGAFWYGKKTIEAPGPLREDTVVNIPQGARKTDIADLLKRADVIAADRWTFIGAVYALNANSGLKSGEYLFQKNASLRDVIGTIVEGKVVQHAFTVPEGLTSEQIVARLTESDIFTGTLKEQPREGTLLPDTYHFPRGTPREQVIQRMQQAQKRVVADVWARRNPEVPLRSPEQLVTLASIVEKETGRADERTRVAAVFANRLRQKIKLQSDPTIIYGLVGGKGTLGRPIKRSEIQQPSPTTPTSSTACRRTDRQSGPRLAGGHRQSGAHPRSLFRRRRQRRSRLRRDLRPAPEGRRQAARHGAPAAERHAGARRSAAGRLDPGLVRPAVRGARRAEGRCQARRQGQERRGRPRLSLIGQCRAGAAQARAGPLGAPAETPSRRPSRAARPRRAPGLRLCRNSWTS